MPINVEGLSGQALANLIANHRKYHATDKVEYLDALAEQALRTGKGLSFQRSFDLIRAAAVEGRFLSYKELADASGANWSQVHYAIGGHLWNLVEYAHRKGWPMLSAIVVNKQHAGTGHMEPKTLKGFVAAARALGLAVTEETAFLKEQQRRVFEWATSVDQKGEAGAVAQPVSNAADE